MSKIEVLRVPDKRIWGGSVRDQGEGAMAILRNGVFRTAVKPEEKPALLAALLEDVGAYEVSIKLGKMEFGDGKGKLMFIPMMFIPIPEDTP